ncbi:hypothetical protein [Chondromyces apiculatus]|uniref:Lipoprotein n=1 Tax=Chondromyces apiculatus DSM 436 TaxID=1192034 RepID=A0A017SWC7_9BACT|nr:hypothetical protein [Chondromyces apiculatus]EYF00920.1 Hypothetical protein CAP_8868 [Chondromyces apiculatus DSM 436]
MKQPVRDRLRPQCAPRALLALVGAFALAGCTGTLGTSGAVVYGYPTAYAEVEPVQIETYPRTMYRGSYAYLVDGSWYYRNSGRWVVFRQEPPELRHYRTRSVEPPRVYERDRGYGYPRERPREYRRWR